MDFLNLILGKVFNKEQLTANIIGLLIGASLIVGNIVFSILGAILGGALAFIIVLVATGFFTYRAALDVEDDPGF